MRITNVKRIVISVNNFRGVIILTYKGSKYDKRVLSNPEWFFPVYECNTKQAFNIIRKVWETNPEYYILKHRY